MKYSDQQRIEKMRTTTAKLLNYIQQEQIRAEDILATESIQWTVTTPLYNIGEQAYNLSAEYKEAHSNIPWTKIAGLRRRLVHSYYETNWELIANVIYNVLPAFCRKLNKSNSPIISRSRKQWAAFFAPKKQFEIRF